MAWGLVLIALALFIGWRRARIDRAAVIVMMLGTTLVVAWAYRGLGG